MKLHRNYQTALGARNLALNIDVERFRFRAETVAEFAMLVAVLGIIFLGWHVAG